ncbi:MAG: polymer-forming cytoskeletal protein [Phycisphaerales bacterium]|nr:polymer-forming cytoskeletal protein [Phycisphaerales bacterium]
MREVRAAAAPSPSATRAVRCPFCEAPFEVSSRAINARCPKCTKPMHFEDAELNGFCNQNVTTMGTVRIGRKGVVRGRIECGALVVSGQLDGTIRINGCCIVQPRGVLRGEIAARSMMIERGGSFEGSVEIGGGAAARPAA